jgi:hypothetical protein
MKFPIKKPEELKPSTNPIKKEPEDDDFEEIEDEDDEVEDVTEKETLMPTDDNKKYAKPLNNQEAELELELKLRELADLERQLRTRKIAIKNENDLTGIMSEQGMLSLTARLKYEINSLVEYMKKVLKYDDKFFIEMFKTVEQGIKNYEYWLITEKKL